MNDTIISAICSVVNAAYDTGYTSSIVEHSSELITDAHRRIQNNLIAERERCVNALIGEIDNESREQYDVLTAAGIGSAPVDVCTWTMSPAVDEENVFVTSCGQEFIFLSEGPVENSMVFCCYCGRKLVAGELNKKNTDG